MNTLLSLLAMAVLCAGVPHNHHDEAWGQQAELESHGPWVEVDDTYYRGPKEIASPTAVLGRASSFWDWDREVVKKGIFENENIMIHVGQNLFNFIMTTLAWFTVSQIYSLTAQQTSTSGRQQKSLSLTEAADEVLEAIRNFEHKY